MQTRPKDIKFLTLERAWQNHNVGDTIGARAKKAEELIKTGVAVPYTGVFTRKKGLLMARPEGLYEGETEASPEDGDEADPQGLLKFSRGEDTRKLPEFVSPYEIIYNEKNKSWANVVDTRTGESMNPHQVRRDDAIALKEQLDANLYNETVGMP